jgi:hypothetical protein
MISFLETEIFTEDLLKVLSDDDFQKLQKALGENPELGKIIPGGGGIRKVRWNLPDSGKRGGLRIIYYWVVSRDLIYLLLIYKKTVQENLAPEQIAVLKRLVKGEFK